MPPHAERNRSPETVALAAFHAARSTIDTARLSRRHLLQAGGLGLMGLTLPRVLRAAADEQNPAPRADHCIVLFLNGGPSHLDMWDPLPEPTPRFARRSACSTRYCVTSSAADA